MTTKLGPSSTVESDPMTATLDRPNVAVDPSFTVDRALFAEACAAVARALPGRPSVPILAGARLSVEGDTLTLSGFDYETSTEVVVACEGAGDGTVVVSGALLANIAKSLPAKPVNVTVEGSKATVVCGSSRFTLPTMPAEDYPALPAMPPVSGSVEARTFAEAVDAVKSAVGTDDALPMLTGIHVTFEQDRMTLAATDRFRLAVTTVDWASTGEPPAPILVPGKSLVEAARGMNAGTVELAVGEGVLGITHGRTASTMRLLDAEFPAFRRLLPEQHARVAEVDVAELEQAVKRAALVADRGSRVALTFDAGTLTVASGDDGSESCETVPCTLAGEALTIAFNPGYLLSGLATIDRDNVLIGMDQPARPAVFAPSQGGGRGGAPGSYPPVYSDHLYLLMPVRMPG